MAALIAPEVREAVIDAVLEQGLSRAEVARRLGLDPRTVRRLVDRAIAERRVQALERELDGEPSQNGHREPRVFTDLWDIAEALGVKRPSGNGHRERRGMLTDEEVLERFGWLLEEAERAYLEDPSYLFDMVSAGAVYAAEMTYGRGSPEAHAVKEAHHYKLSRDPNTRVGSGRMAGPEGRHDLVVRGAAYLTSGHSSIHTSGSR